MWKLRDTLNKEVSNEDKKTLLSDNNQVIPPGESRVSVNCLMLYREDLA